MSSNKKNSGNIPGYIKKKIDKIRVDNKNGALKISKSAANILLNFVENYNISKDTKLLNSIKLITKDLVLSQPNMASIFNFSNDLMIGINSKNNEEDIIKFVSNYCKKFLINLSNSNKLISNFTTDLIIDNSTIVVHSYSSTVLDALYNAKNNGKKFNVICTESRPIKEGLKFAKNLDKNNIEASIVVDSAIFSLLRDVDFIFVGADSISHKGLVNKIGTLGLAIVAEKYDKKIYSLCNINKILPINYLSKVEKLKSSSEITTSKYNNVKIINYYFDTTPLIFFTGLITEYGIKSSKEINDLIIKKKIHKNFT